MAARINAKEDWLLVALDRRQIADVVYRLRAAEIIVVCQPCNGIKSKRRYVKLRKKAGVPVSMHS